MTAERPTTGEEIRQLDPRTVERIAAGEVVERPASVVKELVENSLDADASRVSVAVEAGGTEGIRVSDDGVGMDRAAVERAVEKHTTSKIADIEDLESGVATLGFRGEALHAIGAVSRLTITTRPREGDTGTELLVEGGDVTDVGPAGCPEGTTIEVEDLFYNVPARRKYLKTEATEFAHVNTVVTAYALANPDVAVELSHDGRETFATTGQGDLRETVLSVYGGEVARAMLPVAGGEPPESVGIDVTEDPVDLPDGPLKGVAGLVSHPETNRSGREYLSTYVNGRYVRSSAVREAVVEAYGPQLAPDRYPFAVLFLEIDPATIDVNVHPRKTEIRFADEEGVREQVETAVEEALLREGLIRSGAPRGRSAPEQTEITPGGDGGDAGDAPAREEQSEPEARDFEAGDSSGAATTDEPRTASTQGGETGAATDRSATESSPGVSGEKSAGDGSQRTSAPSTTSDVSTSESPSEQDRTSTTTDAGTSDDIDRPTASNGRTERTRDAGRKFRGATEQERLGEAPEEAFDSLPSLRILGQLHDTYVVAETDDGLLLIDQHAADERINYERLRERFAGETATQALADPVKIELTAREAAMFEEYGEALARLGFHADRVDERTVAVRTLPGVLAESAGPDVVRDVLSAFVGGEDTAADTVEAAADELLADLACYPSITGNTSLTDGSIRSLLSALDDCENPYACPHGRPVVIELDGGELADRFERDYPGHGGRRE